MCCKVQCSTKKHSKCSGSGSDHQPFPEMGLLSSKSQRDLSLLELGKIADQNVVFFYVMTSIKYDGRKFLQCGTGPNFQGDRITLCTCKHLMRSSMDVREWRGKWIAGFTGIREHQRKNFLFYLMKVSEAFESFHKLWNNNVPDRVKKAKAAHNDKYGDIYKPNHKDIRSYEVEDYEKPCKNHKRGGDWLKDIKYEKGYSGRHAALLVGDTTKSFLWDKPMIRYPIQLSRNYQKLKFNEFLDRLRE